MSLDIRIEIILKGAGECSQRRVDHSRKEWLENRGDELLRLIEFALQLVDVLDFDRVETQLPPASEDRDDLEELHQLLANGLLLRLQESTDGQGREELLVQADHQLDIDGRIGMPTDELFAGRVELNEKQACVTLSLTRGLYVRS